MEMEYGYHRGDLDYGRKAEPLYSMSPGRSTGFFGTGFYFTKGFKLPRENRDRDIWEIDISKYNLYPGSVMLHEYLKAFNRFVCFYPYTKVNEDDWFTVLYYYRRIESLANWVEKYQAIFDNPQYYQNYEGEWEEELNSQLEEINKLSEALNKAGFKEQASQIDSQLLSDRVDVEVFKELDNSICFDSEWVSKLRETISDVRNDYLGIGNELYEVAELIYQQYREYYDDGILYSSKVPNARKLDSIPTILLKYLGYEGVNPDEATNSSSYGGVIYDLKEGTYRKLIGESLKK